MTLAWHAVGILAFGPQPEASKCSTTTSCISPVIRRCWCWAALQLSRIGGVRVAGRRSSSSARESPTAARTSTRGWPLKPSDRPTARKRGPDPDPPVPDRIRPDRACIHRGDWRCLGVGTELAGKTAGSAHGQALAEPDSAQWDRHETGQRRGRRVEIADTAPITVVADPDAAARLDPTRRLITVAGVLGTPRYDSLPDGRTPVAAAGR